MRIITPNRPVFCDDYMYRPFCRYIVSDWEASHLVANTPLTEWKYSSFNAYERRYGGQDLNGKKVAIYRHTAFGDQLMISAVPKFLKSKYPDATIHLYCDPKIADMWKNNPFVGGAAIPIPIPFDVARAYDYHIFYEGILENNGEPDQNCCYDDVFNMIGCDPSPQWKRPHIIIRPEDYEFARNRKFDLHSPYIVYHLAPANKNRAYPPEQGAEFVKMFLETHHEYQVVILGKEEDKNAVYGPFNNIPRVVDLVNETKSFRETIPFVENAKCVVCPDSSVLHLASCFPDVPVVSVWGVFHPDDRAKYYPNHHPLFKPEVCQFAPCRNHEFTLPLHMCTKSSNWIHGQRYCAVICNVKPHEILEKVIEVMK
jgi:ADP-heptose:LPS heptosyltransferase